MNRDSLVNVDATYRALASAAELGEFTVPVLAARTGIKETTVRTVLNRHRHLFDRRVGDSGRRGGQPQVWTVKGTAKTALDEIVGGIATRFDDDEGRLLPVDEAGSTRTIARLRVSGDNPELVTAEDLEQFASHLTARELLPHLVRRLLVASPGVTAVSVRAGDAIGLKGYDGRVEASAASPFVPEGRSVWEVGTGQDPRHKAQRDLRTRTNTPEDVDPSTTTFVTVSMRRFPDKDDWAAAARASGGWRDVRALDADDLLAWLEAAPHIHVWASESMGLRPLDVTSLSCWWDVWLAQTDPPLPPDLLLAGRQPAAAELRKSLGSGGRAIGVYASSREEAIAFTAAALLKDDEADGYVVEGAPLSSGVVVYTVQTWNRLLESRNPALYVPLFEGADVASALQRGHTVVVPMGPSDDRSRAGVEVPRIDRAAARDAFHRADPTFDLEDADQRAAHARRSLVSFRRSFAVNPVRKNPAWAQSGQAEILAPLVLAGSWECESAADQSLVAELVGQPYARIEATLRRPVDPEDPPLIRAGNRWQLTSPVDAWNLLSTYLTTADIERWMALALWVLGEPDPTVDLSEEDRLLAPIQGIKREYSGALRSGLARGAALMSSGAALSNAPNGQNWSEQPGDLVRSLLSAPPEPQRWSSLEDVLPALAEAAPEVFLDATSRGLAGANPPLSALFADAGNNVWGARSPHTGLLWALEMLCWSGRHVAAACDVLARLAEVDPGGRLANRPAASLRRVLLPWYPQTAAPKDHRMQIVSGLLARRPTIGWQLLLGLLRQHHEVRHSTCRPVFRDWKTQAVEATFRERLDVTHRLADLALNHLRENVSGWSELIEALPNLPLDDLERCLKDLDEVDVAAVPPAPRMKTWQSLIKLVTHHRQFPAAQWAMSEDWLCEFERIAVRWEPQDVPGRHARLFDWHPDLPGTDKFDNATYEQTLAERRRAAVRSGLAENRLSELSGLIEKAPVPGFVGATVAEVAGDEVAQDMLLLFVEPGAAQSVAHGWAVRMSELAGRTWVDRMLERAKTLPTGIRVPLYRSLPLGRSVWEAIDTETAEVADQFWQGVGTFGVSSEDTPELVQRLLDHRRPWSAVDLLARHLHRDGAGVPAALIESTLRSASGPDTDERHPPGSIDYALGVLLDRFVSAGGSDDTQFVFEWTFYGILQHTRTPRAVFRAIAERPSLFVELVNAAFRATSEPATNETTPAQVALARQAYMVLRDWRQPPGLSDDGHVDGEALRAWVAAARGLLADADRVKIGDECIAEVLSGSPVGVDGIWPAEPIRDLLEELESEAFTQGLAIGRFNSRGATSRGVFDGGRQEDALADQYDAWAGEVMARWPQAGRLLRELAGSYRRWADRQDAMAEEWASSG
jgi:hypothetical protein